MSERSSVFRLPLSSDDNVHSARRLAFGFGEAASLSPRRRTSFATVTSEVARYAHSETADAALVFEIGRDDSVWWIEVVAEVPGSREDEPRTEFERFAGLVDEFRIEPRQGILCLFIRMRIAPDDVSWEDLRQLVETGLARHATDDPHVELIKQNQRLIHSLEKSRQRERAAEQLMGIVSHDLRNPLTVAKLSVQMLDRGATLDERQQGYAEKILHAVERAEALVRDLLDFTSAKLAAGIQVKARPIDLHGTVADALEQLRIAHTDAMFEHEAVGDGSIRADPARIQQVVVNLVDNAVRYGDEDTIRVETTVDAGRASLMVENRGPTIAPDELDRLFDAYERNGNGDLGERSIGLGLFIVSEIASAHGGEALGESANGITRLGIAFPTGAIGA